MAAFLQADGRRGELMEPPSTDFLLKDGNEVCRRVFQFSEASDSDAQLTNSLLDIGHLESCKFNSPLEFVQRVEVDKSLDAGLYCLLSEQFRRGMRVGHGSSGFLDY